jgi:hypothetical protein
MGPVLQFIRPFDVFDSATLTILSKAYDEALVSLHDHGQPMVVRETIALRLFDLASKGERDPQRLREAALRGILKRTSGVVAAQIHASATRPARI